MPKVFIDYGMTSSEKERLGLKWGWLTLEEAEESKRKYEYLLRKNTHRRSAKCPDKG